MNDWPERIATVALIQQDLMKIDTVFDYHLPEVAATEAQVAAVESCLGLRLPEDYRQFLLAANGWQGVMQDNDLWGTDMLADAASQRDVRAGAGEYIDAGGAPEIAAAPNDWLLIGGSRFHPDYFVLALAGSGAGQVRWLTSGEVDSFENFSEFFLTLADYNRVTLKHVRARAGKG